MIKKTILVIAIALLFVSCSSSSVDTNTSETNKQFLLNEQQDYQEKSISLKLPSEYKKFTQLVGADEEFYYFANNDDAKYWKHIAVNKNTHKVNSLANIDKNVDIKSQYGRYGQFYVATLKWEADQTNCKFAILDLTNPKKAENIYSKKSSGLPSIVPCGDYLAIQSNTETECQLDLVNLFTKDIKTICSTTYSINDMGKINGTVIMGLEWDKPTPTTNGFAYEICNMDNENIDIEKTKKQNTVYYYSIEDGKIIKMAPHYRPLDYVGGTADYYITSDWQNNVAKDYIWIYLKEEGDYTAYSVPAADEAMGIIGSGVIGNNLFVAYTRDGFYILNIKDKTYIQKTYSTVFDSLSSEERKSLDYKNTITGFTFFQNIFTFSSFDGKTLALHEVSKK